ncbi:DUF7486 family protein [Winogradskyella alexanderae]|uniref:DUF7486 domain-containing protein n=1 Tax=Winogradskyella alexanderae TaxID=2877123 RepID=A0ABS7XRW0_9FLAO|nr:hypothetical protein [Winogradskyella alexanderae]MCA0132745.1 hypothetical protein [Winogradskyella alexanderae]
MKTTVHYFKQVSFVAFLILFVGSYSIGNAQDKENAKPETELHPEIFWDVKAYRPETTLLQVKAVDKDGNYHDVKAIQYSEDTSLLDVKVLMNNQRLPIKLIDIKGEAFHPLKGIDLDGNLLDIVALTESGEVLEVKGVSRSGNIIHIRAIAEYGLFYNIISISSDGSINDVKGLKMLTSKVEGIINGVPIFAHVKSVQQDHI